MSSCMILEMSRNAYLSGLQTGSQDHLWKCWLPRLLGLHSPLFVLRCSEAFCHRLWWFCEQLSSFWLHIKHDEAQDKSVVFQFKLNSWEVIIKKIESISREFHMAKIIYSVMILHFCGNFNCYLTPVQEKRFLKCILSIYYKQCWRIIFTYVQWCVKTAKISQGDTLDTAGKQISDTDWSSSKKKQEKFNSCWWHGGMTHTNKKYSPSIEINMWI